MAKAPDHWYQYEFPLPEVKKAPVPSQANYEPRNVAWMIEMFAQVLGQNHTSLRFRYENNTPNNPWDDIYVEHPNDKLYFTEKARCDTKNQEMIQYETKARQSDILRLFQDYSPAEINYFGELGCASLVSPIFALPPLNIVSSNGFSGYLGDTLDSLSVDKVESSLDEPYFANTAQENQFVTFEFQNLPEDAPEEYSSVILKLHDKAASVGNSAGCTLSTGSDFKRSYYTISQGYTYRQFVWARGFTKEDINNLRFRYHDGANPLLLPIKHLTAVELVAQSVL
jgi:hypothetical protein